MNETEIADETYSEEDGADESGASAAQNYATRSPLLDISWGQDSPQNKYCKRNNFRGRTVHALTGCSTTAMAMIVTYNEYPDGLIINNDTLDWNGMKATVIANDLDSSGQEDVALLTGSILNYVDHISLKNSTLITPEQIKRRMKDFGYANVEKISSGSLSKEMISAVSDMLGSGKPAFISAIPPLCNIKDAHSWVIDGAKYASATSSSYLLHFNFGWERNNNGHYSKTCLNPTKAVEYDDLTLGNQDSEDNYYYTWHFRLITYDRPNNRYSKKINYIPLSIALAA